MEAAITTNNMGSQHVCMLKVYLLNSLFNKFGRYVLLILADFTFVYQVNRIVWETMLSWSIAAFHKSDLQSCLVGKNDTNLLTHYGFLHKEPQNQNTGLAACRHWGHRQTLRLGARGCFQNRGTPKWMVKIMENPIEMDDLGGNPPIFGNIQDHFCSQLHQSVSIYLASWVLEFPEPQNPTCFWKHVKQWKRFIGDEILARYLGIFS